MNDSCCSKKKKRENCKWSNKSFTSRQRSNLLINYVFAFYHILSRYGLWLSVGLPTPIPCLPLASKFKNAVIKQLHLLDSRAKWLRMNRADKESSGWKHFGVYSFYNWVLFLFFLHCSSFVGKKTGCNGVAPSRLNNTVRLAHVDE